MIQNDCAAAVLSATMAKALPARPEVMPVKQMLAALLAAVFLLCGCASSPGSGTSASAPQEPEGFGGSTRRDAVSSEELQFNYSTENATIVSMETSRGTIRFVLFPECAPLAVENFCKLARQGYYDGTDFHRAVRDFAIQGGDATGTGLSGQSIWGHTFSTERSDRLRHYSGALCMATADGLADTHLSQFYIVATPQDGLGEDALQKLRDAGVREAVVEAYRQAGGAPYLDNTDTVFGQVIEGMDVVDTIAKTAVDEDGRPKTAVTITKVTVESYPPGDEAYVPPALAGAVETVSSSQVEDASGSTA